MPEPKRLPMPHYVTRRRVEFAETDMAGIVHFANFFRWMEEAEHEYFRSLGLTIVYKQDGGVHVGWPRVSASCNFHKPLFYEDEFEVRVTVERLGVKSINYHFELWRDADHIATGRLKVACCLCGAEGIIRSIEIPAEYLAKLPAGAREG
jgi:YbgC/YbaW family acyl-CoA thioester hydrolase